MDNNRSKQQESVKAVFDAFAPDYVELFMDLKQYATGINDFVQRLGDNPSLLDLGCGPGNIASAVFKSNQNAKVIGVDLSPKMIELAKTYVPKGEFFIGDISAPSDFGSNFDGVILGFILPYLRPDSAKELFGKVNEVLNADSHILVLTMIDEKTKTVERNSHEEYSIQMTYYSEIDLKKIISEVGFNVMHEELFVNDYNGEKEILLIAKKV